MIDARLDISQSHVVVCPETTYLRSTELLTFELFPILRKAMLPDRLTSDVLRGPSIKVLVPAGTYSMQVRDMHACGTSRSSAQVD